MENQIEVEYIGKLDKETIKNFKKELTRKNLKFI